MNFEYLGPYRVEKILGRGGMGTVYLGTHANSGDSVAIKVIASELADQERFRRRFAAEVETLKRLKHINIVQLIGYGEEQGHLFYSMEYVTGHSLAETLKKNTRLPWDRSIEIAIEVCSALKHAHDWGIIHRDLKPSNVLLTGTGQVKLTDFGIAKLYGSSDVTAAGSVLGTADYMPPEQAEGKPVTVRSDLYALGSLIFAMVSGRSPHAAKSVPEVLYNVRYAVPQPLDAIVPGTPPELSELVTHLLAKESNQRPPTALVVINRLQSLQQGLKRRHTASNESQSIDTCNPNAVDSIEREADQPKEELGDILAKAEEQTQVIHPDQSFASRKVANEHFGSTLANAQTQAASHLSDLELGIIDDSVPPGRTRFTVVEEENRTQNHFGGEATKDTHHSSHLVSVATLILLLAASVGTIAYFTRSPSADRLYAEIEAAIESGSNDDIMRIEPVIEHFESLYPNDVRLSELAPIKSEIEEQRTVQRLLRRSKVVGSEAEMDPVEQAFLDCMRAQQQDTELAKRKIRAFLNVFDRPEALTTKQQRLVEIAANILKKLNTGLDLKTNPATALLNEQIDWAAANLSGEPQRTFYRSLLELYADKPWAAPSIARVQRLLAVPTN